MADMPGDGEELGFVPDKNFIEINYDNVKTDTVFVDVLYFPMITGLLQSANIHGHRYINGIDMLVFQAFKSFEIWTGIKIYADEHLKVNNKLLNVVEK